MLMVNSLAGFGAAATATPAGPTAVSRSAGTAIGNQMDGFAAAFDDSLASWITSTTTAAGWGQSVGKHWSSPKTIGGFVARSPGSPYAFDGQNGSNPVRLRGSNDGSNWTDLWSGMTPAGTAAVLTVDSGINISAAYTWHLVEFSQPGGAYTRVAELEFTEIL